MKIKLIIVAVILVCLGACTTKAHELKNTYKGQLKATKTLKLTEIKKIELDSNTASSPQYTQMFKDTSGINYFTFLNNYTGSIYFYNYNTLEYVKQITYDKKGPNGILKPMGYHIKTMDSIYVYNMVLPEIVLTNSTGKVLSKKSLRGKKESKDWYVHYPQYYPETVTPFIATNNKLLLTGQSFVSLSAELIDKFKFTANINFDMNNVEFTHTYPKELYGNDYNWIGDLYTKVFPELHPDGNKLIYSFPISHDLYITDLNSNTYKKVYAGSNDASTIYSVDKSVNKTSNETILVHYSKQNDYAAIKYDKYRDVYYRFFKKAILNGTVHSKPKDKPIGVIIMDKDFNYLGETILGTGKEWYWQNSFVTEEGLNIEYLDQDDIDEVALTLKIFTIEDL